MCPGAEDEVNGHTNGVNGVNGVNGSEGTVILIFSLSPSSKGHFADNIRPKCLIMKVSPLYSLVKIHTRTLPGIPTATMLQSRTS